MNTVDAITQQGGACANFLDTGGKATAETVKSSFRIVGADPRVRAIFVNIFGGLTRCNMIAEGVIMAFRDLDMQVPVVVRLRGTFEEIGQTMVSECDNAICSNRADRRRLRRVSCRGCMPMTVSRRLRRGLLVLQSRLAGILHVS